MKVKKLIKKLQSVSPNSEVYLSQDNDGNGFNKLTFVDTTAVLSQNGDVFDSDWTASEAGMDEEDWKTLRKLPRVVVLWP